MKDLRRIIALMLVCLIIGSTVAWAADDANEIDVGNPNYNDVPCEEDYALTYNPQRYEHSFEFGQVVVSFKYGVIITERFEELFPELEIKSVSIVTPGGYTKRGKLNRELILINLKDETRKAVIDAVSYIKTSPYVYLTEPNYTFSGYEYVIHDEPHAPGDVNKDGKVGNDDLIMTARHVVKLAVLEGAEFTSADINKDGTVNNQDVIIIAKTVVGLE